MSSEQLTCPVCVSKKLKKNLYVDYDGQRIYLCSGACKGRVGRNPQAFIEKLEKRGEKAEKL
jgi:YHS domain-containing protein